MQKFVLFLVGFLIAFFVSYIMCTEHLSDELSGTVLEYKDQVKYLKILKKFYTWGQFQNRPCAPHPSPLSGKPPGIWLLSKFWSNSLVCWQFRWSNTPSASASRSVKSPIQQRLFNKFPSLRSWRHCVIKVLAAIQKKEWGRGISLGFAPHGKTHSTGTAAPPPNLTRLVHNTASYAGYKFPIRQTIYLSVSVLLNTTEISKVLESCLTEVCSFQ